MDSILFFLCKKDLSKLPVIKQQRIKDIYEWYYQERVDMLNGMLDNIAHIQHIERLNK